MQLEVGDTVQLTAAVMINIAEQRPDILQAMTEHRRTGGEIKSIEGGQVAIDMGAAVRGHLIIDVDGSHPHLALQLIKKHNKDAVVGPYEAAAAAAATHDAGNVGVFMSHGRTEIVPQVSPLSRYMQLGQLHPAAQEEVVPTRIRIAQWAVAQFLGLKQYGIAQDLQRHSDEMAPTPDPDNIADNWRGAEGRNLRAVQVELSATEEQCYNAALREIQEWVTATGKIPVQGEALTPSEKTEIPRVHITTTPVAADEEAITDAEAPVIDELSPGESQPAISQDETIDEH